METVDLHAQKVTILSRLIKESSLTLEEALLLLKEEEKEEEPSAVEPGPVPYHPQTSTGTWTTTPGTYRTYTTAYPAFLSGVNTSVLPVGGSNVSFSNNTPVDESADLNN